MAQGADEFRAPRYRFDMVAREMQISSATPRLPIQIAEIALVMGAHEHMEGVRPTGHGFQPVQLIDWPVARLSLHEMLGFIDHHSFHLQAQEGVLHGLAQIEPLGRVAYRAGWFWCIREASPRI
jgi:hypothetical protein